MKSFRSKPVGWRGESHRHYLAAKGIKTNHKYYAYTPAYVAGDLPLIATDALGTAGAAVVPWIPVAVPLVLLYGGAKYVKKKKDKTGSYFSERDEPPGTCQTCGGLGCRDCDDSDEFQGVYDAGEDKMMSFSPADLQAFDAAMLKAKEKGEGQFMFKGKPVLVEYGKYVSEYLHGKFKEQHFAKKEDLDALDRAGVLKSREEVDREVAMEEEGPSMTEDQHGAMMQGFAKQAFTDMDQENRGKVMRFLNEQYKKGGEKLANSDETAEEIVRFSLAIMDRKAEERMAKQKDDGDEVHYYTDEEGVEHKQ